MPIAKYNLSRLIQKLLESKSKEEAISNLRDSLRVITMASMLEVSGDKVSGVDYSISQVNCVFLEGENAQLEALLPNSSALDPEASQDYQCLIETTKLLISNISLKQSLAETQNKLKDAAFFERAAIHDLKTPLRTMNLYLTMLKEKNYEMPKDAEEYLLHISSCVERQSNLLDSISSFQEVNQGICQTKPNNIGTLVIQVIDAMHAEVGNADILVDLEDLPPVPIDTALMARVFQNLIQNSLKYKTESERTQIRIQSHINPTEATIYIRDNGIGVSSTTRRRIFKPFARGHTQSEYPGSGLGLAICKLIIKGHGGKIWLDSSSRQGSVFAFSLPLRPMKHLSPIQPSSH